MKTNVTEIADKIYRLSTFVPQIGPTGFTFNQFLIDADQPLLFHYGHRAMFPLISKAVASVIPLERLRWTTCSHVEGDESGALNEWLAAAPNATPAHGQTGVNIWLADMANRGPRTLKNDEVIDLGGKTVRWLDTPHVPHNWDAGLIYEETTGTLFSSDLFTQGGPCEATTTGDIVDAAIATEKAVPLHASDAAGRADPATAGGAEAQGDRADARAELSRRWRRGFEFTCRLLRGEEWLSTAATCIAGRSGSRDAILLPRTTSRDGPIGIADVIAPSRGADAIGQFRHRACQMLPGQSAIVVAVSRRQYVLHHTRNHGQPLTTNKRRQGVIADLPNVISPMRSFASKMTAI